MPSTDNNREILQAAIDSAVHRGLDVIDAVRGAPAGRRDIQRAARYTATQARKTIRGYRRRKVRYAVVCVGGAMVTVLAITIGVGAAPTNLPLAVPWFVAGTGALAAAVWGGLAWRRTQPPAPPPAFPAAPPLVRRGAIGYPSVSRYVAVRAHTIQVVRAITLLHPQAAADIRSADAQAAPPLNALVHRLHLLDNMSRSIPTSSSAASARSAATAVSQQLDKGSASYDVLLAAAAQLLAEPALNNTGQQALEPAAEALIAYAHGLRTASQI